MVWKRIFSNIIFSQVLKVLNVVLPQGFDGGCQDAAQGEAIVAAEAWQHGFYGSGKGTYEVQFATLGGQHQVGKLVAVPVIECAAEAAVAVR